MYRDRLTGPIIGLRFAACNSKTIGSVSGLHRYGTWRLTGIVRLEHFDYYNKKQNEVLYGTMENMDFLLPIVPSLVFARETYRPYRACKSRARKRGWGQLGAEHPYSPCMLSRRDSIALLFLFLHCLFQVSPML